MGNVIASSMAQPPMPSAAPPPNIPEQPGISKDKDAGVDRNPGTIEDLHKKCKDVFPAIFEGSRLVVNKVLSNHFQINHQIVMSSLSPSGYKFGATYVGTQAVSPVESYPILVGNMDPNGNLDAQIIHQFNSYLRTKFVAQIQDSKYMANQFNADYRGLDYTASFILGSIDINNGSGVSVLHYLQNVVPSLALGAEVAYQYGPAVPGGEMALLSLAGRYTTPNYTLSGTIGSSSIHACYHRKENDYIQVGVEVETNFRLGESVCSLGYQVDLPKGNLVFRGMVDSNWTVGAVLEKKLQPLPFTLSLSGMINHTKGQSRFGIGLIIG